MSELPKIDVEEMVDRLRTMQAALVCLCIKTVGFTLNLVGESTIDHHNFFNMTSAWLHHAAYETGERIGGFSRTANYCIDDLAVAKDIVKQEKSAIVSFDRMAPSLVTDYENLSLLSRYILQLASECADGATIKLATTLDDKLCHFGTECRRLSGRL